MSNYLGYCTTHGFTDRPFGRFGTLLYRGRGETRTHKAAFSVVTAHPVSALPDTLRIGRARLPFPHPTISKHAFIFFLMDTNEEICAEDRFSKIHKTELISVLVLHGTYNHPRRMNHCLHEQLHEDNRGNR